MLTISDGGRGIHRRDFLTIGSLGLGGLSLSSLLTARAAAAEQQSSLIRDKAVIFVFQQGGPSQFETFDPKMDAPDAIRTVTGSVNTSLPGVIFGDTMQQLAKIADKLTIVRSFQTNNGGHNIRPIVGPETSEANISAYYARVVGPTRADTGMPTSSVLFPQAVDDKITKGRARGNIAATGSVGSLYAPFIPGAGGQLQSDMSLNIQRDRFEDRRTLLAQLDRLNQRIDAQGKAAEMDNVQRQAYQVLTTGGVAEALDLSNESKKTIDQYDTSRFARADGWKKKNRGKRGYYTGHAKSFGKLLLLSRRLCEAGCGYVTVHAGYDGVWDMHADGNNLDMKDGMEAVGRSFDHGVAALVQDIEARGLQDKILVVCCGEMGRTPKINKRGGRDHWGRLAPLLMYGGGIKGGQVIGRSTSNGGEPSTQNITPQHLISSILHTVFDPGILRVTPGLTQVSKLSEHDPIPELW